MVKSEVIATIVGSGIYIKYFYVNRPRHIATIPNASDFYPIEVVDIKSDVVASSRTVDFHLNN